MSTGWIVMILLFFDPSIYLSELELLDCLQTNTNVIHRIGTLRNLFV